VSKRLVTVVSRARRDNESTADYCRCKAEKCGMVGYVAVTAINTGADTDGRRYLGTCAWAGLDLEVVQRFATRRQVVAGGSITLCTRGVGRRQAGTS
jgi:hypothetical protein